MGLNGPVHQNKYQNSKIHCLIKPQRQRSSSPSTTIYQSRVEPIPHTCVPTTFGAVDPNSGTAALLEFIHFAFFSYLSTNKIARRLKMLQKRGWKPRRTIILCNWDAEEYGLVGSTEWVEGNKEMLASKAVAYLNVDCAVRGPGFHASASPQLDELLKQATKHSLDRQDDHCRPVVFALWSCQVSASLYPFWDFAAIFHPFWRRLGQHCIYDCSRAPCHFLTFQGTSTFLDIFRHFCHFLAFSSSLGRLSGGGHPTGVFFHVPPETHPTGDAPHWGLHRVVGPTVGTGGSPTRRAESRDSTGWWAPLWAPVGLPPGELNTETPPGGGPHCGHRWDSHRLRKLKTRTPPGGGPHCGHRWESHRTRTFISFRFLFFSGGELKTGTPPGGGPHCGHRSESHRARDPGGDPTGCARPRWGSHRVRTAPVGRPPGARPLLRSGGNPTGYAVSVGHPVGPLAAGILYKPVTTCHFHHVELFFVCRLPSEIFRGIKNVQSPENSTSTLYDSWVASNVTPLLQKGKHKKDVEQKKAKESVRKGRHLRPKKTSAQFGIVRNAHHPSGHPWCGVDTPGRRPRRLLGHRAPYCSKSSLYSGPALYSATARAPAFATTLARASFSARAKVASSFEAWRAALRSLTSPSSAASRALCLAERSSQKAVCASQRYFCLWPRTARTFRMPNDLDIPSASASTSTSLKSSPSWTSGRHLASRSRREAVGLAGRSFGAFSTRRRVASRSATEGAAENFFRNASLRGLRSSSDPSARAAPASSPPVPSTALEVASSLATTSEGSMGGRISPAEVTTSSGALAVLAASAVAPVAGTTSCFEKRMVVSTVTTTLLEFTPAGAETPVAPMSSSCRTGDATSSLLLLEDTSAVSLGAPCSAPPTLEAPVGSLSLAQGEPPASPPAGLSDPSLTKMSPSSVAIFCATSGRVAEATHGTPSSADCTALLFLRSSNCAPSSSCSVPSSSCGGVAWTAFCFFRTRSCSASSALSSTRTGLFFAEGRLAWSSFSRGVRAPAGTTSLVAFFFKRIFPGPFSGACALLGRPSAVDGATSAVVTAALTLTAEGTRTTAETSLPSYTLCASTGICSANSSFASSSLPASSSAAAAHKEDRKKKG
ncbi:hypothetical protein Taro_035621 [Colocasia esculenta]|uniref:Peptidase M28 domain-containing protein n=1 Tax=Colocasia esculenta TaxID=4460 RepID=A0A843WJ60_COLES|nr:hypothetical protein [Colocasia esculenta]